jgi:uncharacterized coiled-coil protein SlyX
MRCENCYDTVTEMIAAKDAEIARLNDVVAAMTETADEANRSYIEHHNTIESLRTQLADATRKLEEARKDALEQAAAKCENIADKIGDMNAYNNCHESCCDNSAMRMAYGCAEAIRAIDQAIEQGKGGDDELSRDG